MFSDTVYVDALPCSIVGKVKKISNDQELIQSHPALKTKRVFQSATTDWNAPFIADKHISKSVLILY